MRFATPTTSLPHDGRRMQLLLHRRQTNAVGDAVRRWAKSTFDAIAARLTAAVADADAARADSEWQAARPHSHPKPSPNPNAYLEPSAAEEALDEPSDTSLMSPEFDTWTLGFASSKPGKTDEKAPLEVDDALVHQVRCGTTLLP